VAASLQRYYTSLAHHGTTEPTWPQMLTFDGINELIGTPELLAHARQYE
jgi:hypothetical protein